MNELQKCMLSLLKEFDAICTENGIEYYLAGGTLLGAVRHGGFLPWDDDIDIDMTRENWNKFRQVIESSARPGRALTRTSLYRYVDTTVTRFQPYHLENHQPGGINLDIFVLDPLPDSLEAQATYFDLAVLYVALLLENDFTLRCRKPAPFWRYHYLSKLAGRKRVLHCIKRKMEKLHTPESYCYCSQGAAMLHRPFPKAIYGKPQRILFEDSWFLAPKRPCDWLELRYDDTWMYVPTKDLQIDHAAPINLTTKESTVCNAFNEIHNRKKYPL